MSTLIYTVPRYSSEETNRKEAQRNASVSSTTGSIVNGLKYVGRKLKEHERQSQLAWEAYYGFPTQAGQTRASESPRSASTTSTDSNASVSSPGAVKKAWTSVKEAAKAHHEATNAAYASFYGDSRVHTTRAAEIKKHSVAY